jgi:rod shape determining protein RodA
MSNLDFVRSLPAGNRLAAPRRDSRLHLDVLLLALLLAIMSFGLVVLFSAIDRNQTVLTGQLVRLGLAVVVMMIIAQLDPRVFLRWAPWLYGAGIVMLVLVLTTGTSVKGASRWLDLPGLPRFQPSEILKLGVPLMVAWYLNDRPLPPSFKDLCMALGILLAPAGLIALQPDLGTAILVAGAGMAVLLLSGIYWRWIAVAMAAAAAAAPALWMTMKEYQRGRVLTLFDPERDPLGAGWNIIQSKTAIGSGGLTGKGLFQGTQSHLQFLPESQTDFIIAVVAEEMGFIGVTLLLALYLAVIARGLYIAARAPDTFARLVAGAITLTFFVYVFVNISMVSGLLPVVGIPLPLVSYGGTSAITLLAGFGILMSIHTHRGW